MKDRHLFFAVIALIATLSAVLILFGGSAGRKSDDEIAENSVGIDPVNVNEYSGPSEPEAGEVAGVEDDGTVADGFTPENPTVGESVADSEIGPGETADDEQGIEGTEDTGEDSVPDTGAMPPATGSSSESQGESDENVEAVDHIEIIKQSELGWSYASIHEMDQNAHLGEEFDFESVVSSKYVDSTRDLGVHLDYSPPDNKLLNKTVMGFAPYWALDGYWQDYQMEHLSVIAYFAVACFPDGNLVTSCVNGYCGDKSGWDGWNSASLSAMVDEAHKNGVKVVLTIKNFDKPSIEALVKSDSARDRLVTNILKEIEAKNVDGVNIDFEYIGTATNPLRAKFTSFMDQVADAVHTARPGSHVSVDIMGTSGIDPLIYDVAALGNTSVDAIMVMSYDFHTTRYYDGKMAAPVSPLYGSQYWYNVSRAMSDITQKAPSHKIIMGVPYYGLEFPVSGATWSSKNGDVVGSGAITTYSNVMKPVFDAWHNLSTIQWDSSEKMRWYRYRWPNASSGPEYWQGYYDDEKSLMAKYDYVIDNNLGGIGIWALGYDTGRTELWGAIRDKFSREPIIVLFKDGVSRTRQAEIHDAEGAKIVRLLADDAAVIVKPVNKRSIDLIADYEARKLVVSAGFLENRGLWKE